MVAPMLGEHCKACYSIFKIIESCPRSHIFEQGELVEILLELLWVISSVAPVTICFALVIHSLTKKTARGFFMLMNILVQQTVIVLLKRYFAQPRPLGACSTSFGYPSGHSGFTASLTTWLILEIVVFHHKASFKTSKIYSILRNSFIVMAPFIPVSRYFLNYHSLEQIMYGLLTGFICTLLYFALFMKSLIKKDKDEHYSSGVVKVLGKFSFHDNFIRHHGKHNSIPEQDKQPHQQAADTIHPIRDNILDFFRNSQKKERKAE